MNTCYMPPPDSEDFGMPDGADPEDYEIRLSEMR
jgi:hypothetical protein